MENIIVTVADAKKSFSYDLELPTMVAVNQLKVDIVEALNGCNAALFLNADSVALFCNRLDRYLKKNETLKSAGVWNGDYITLAVV